MLSQIKPLITNVTKPVAKRLARVGVRPNHLTFLGLVFGVFSAYFIIKGLVLIAAVFIMLSSICDLLDGALARTEDVASDFGSFIDSVTDRYVDVVLFTSLGIYGVDWIVVVLAISGALLVSYTRARAENVIDRCDVGIAERSERLLILLAGIISGYIYEAVVLIAFLSHLTALHRIVYTYLRLKT